MKIIIAGSRTVTLDISTIQNLIDILIPMNQEITEIVCGMAKGVDISGKNYAEFQGYQLTKFPADWNKYGKSAGPIRNKEMANYADGLLLIHNGSPGSLNMKNEMLKLHKPVYEVTLTRHVQTGDDEWN